MNITLLGILPPATSLESKLLYASVFHKDLERRTKNTIAISYRKVQMGYSQLEPMLDMLQGQIRWTRTIACTELPASKGCVPTPAHRAESDQGSASEIGCRSPAWMLRADHMAFEMFTSKPIHIQH